MDAQFFEVTGKTTVSLLFIAVIGLVSQTAVAQEEVTITEDNIPRLEDSTILRGTVDDLGGVEPKSFPENSFAVGGLIDDNPDNDSVYQIQIDSGLEIEVNSRSQDWRNLNSGDGSRGSARTPVLRF